MSIKIESTEGDIEGEYIEKQGEIEVWNWKWELTHDGKTHHGKGGGGQGELTVEDLTFEKPVDKSSPALIRMLVRGTGFNTATLTVRKASGGDKSFDYFKITMTDGVISSIKPNADKANPQMTETIKLNFPKFKVEYVSQESANTPGESVPMGWDIVAKKDL